MNLQSHCYIAYTTLAMSLEHSRELDSMPGVCSETFKVWPHYRSFYISHAVSRHNMQSALDSVISVTWFVYFLMSNTLLLGFQLFYEEPRRTLEHNLTMNVINHMKYAFLWNFELSLTNSTNFIQSTWPN